MSMLTRTRQPGPSSPAPTDSDTVAGMAKPLTLAELRNRQGKTQVDLAKELGITQASVSALELRADPLVSSLTAYVQALGGELELIAVLGGSRVVLDLEDAD